MLLVTVYFIVTFVCMLLRVLCGERASATLASHIATMMPMCRRRRRLLGDESFEVVMTVADKRSRRLSLVFYDDYDDVDHVDDDAQAGRHFIIILNHELECYLAPFVRTSIHTIVDI